MDSIESKRGLESRPRIPRDRETPITLNILIIPFSFRLLVSSASLDSISLKDTGRSVTPRSFAVSKIPFGASLLALHLVGGELFDLPADPRPLVGSILVSSKS